MPVFLPPRRGLGWRAVLALTIATFAIGAVLIAVLVRQHPGWFGVSRPATVATLQGVRTASGETPVVIVPGNGPPATMPAVDLNALSTREAALSARLSDLEMRTAAVGGDAAAASGYATRAESMLVAFAARRAIDRGVALGYLEEQLRDRFGGVQPRAVGTIITAARSPVTLADLRGGMDAVAPSLVSGGGHRLVDQAAAGVGQSDRRAQGRRTLAAAVRSPGARAPADRRRPGRGRLWRDRAHARCQRRAGVAGGGAALRDGASSAGCRGERRDRRTAAATTDRAAARRRARRNPRRWRRPLRAEPLDQRGGGVRIARLLARNEEHEGVARGHRWWLGRNIWQALRLFARRPSPRSLRPLVQRSGRVAQWLIGHAALEPSVDQVAAYVGDRRIVRRFGVDDRHPGGAAQIDECGHVEAAVADLHRVAQADAVLRRRQQAQEGREIVRVRTAWSP